jgi:hypothetical protein
MSNLSIFVYIITLAIANNLIYSQTFKNAPLLLFIHLFINCWDVAPSGIPASIF